MLVSVAITTFNQVNFLRTTIESILKQEITFEIEIVISDDLSTDGTQKIVEGYAYDLPGIIKVVSPLQNIGMTQNFNHVLGKCSGKYIALCDGDDYWTDIQKLQKQVDFLEKHPAYSFCCHGYSFIYNDGRTDDATFNELVNEFPKGFDITVKNILDKWVTQPLTVVFRKNNIALPIQRYLKVYDIVLFTELLLTGNARWLPFNAGCYRLHTSNYWNSLDYLQKFKKEYETFKEINKNHPQQTVFAKAVLRANFYIVKYLCKKNETKNKMKELTKYSLLLFKNGFANFSSVSKLLFKTGKSN